MDALSHADQMRLANLINDNSDDAEIKKKLDQVIELTSSTRDQASVALHDCNYDVEKAVDMILEGDQAVVQNQWKSAGKKKNKNNPSQTGKNQIGTATSSSSNKHANSGTNNHHHQQQHHNQHHHTNHHNNNKSNQVSASNQQHHQAAAGAAAAGSHHAISNNQMHHHPSSHQNIRNNTNTSNQQGSASLANPNHHYNNNNNSKQDNSDNMKNLVGISASNLINSSDSTTTTSTTSNAKNSSLQQQQQNRQQLQRGGTMPVGNRQSQQHLSRSTRIPDSAVEMPNSELQVSSLNVQFGELDLREGASSIGATDAKGTFQDVLESSRLGRHQAGFPNSYSNISSQDNRSNRQQLSQQQHLNKGGNRRQQQYSGNSSDDRRFNSSSNRGGRQISGNQRPYNQRQQGPMNNSNTNNSNNTNNSRVRTILNRGMQTNPTLSSSGATSNPAAGGFPNSIDTWSNSTAEAAAKTTVADQAIAGVGNALRAGQWSDVAGNEDWSEEDWDAKVMETKVFTPSSKTVDGPVTSQKSQPLLTDASGVPGQINLASKLSETVRDDVSSQQSTLNSVAQQGQPQQSSQKQQLANMSDIFEASVAKAVLEQQQANLASMKPKTSLGMSQYNKDSSDPKTVLDQSNMTSMKPKTTMNMNQYNKEASESLKSLVGISSAKSNVPSVPPGALPLMSQPQYIMGNAYQPAIFPYAYQTPDVHYQVAAQTAAAAAGRDQTFQSVYSPSEATKFSRGTDGDAPSISTTQAAPVASQTHTNQQAFVANALHGYQLTYAMPGAFNMMPQNLYSAPIFSHIPQPTNTGSASNVYPKNTAASYQHHTGYSTYDQSLNPLIQDYVKQPNFSTASSNLQQQQQPTSKASGVANDLDTATSGNSYNMYGSMNKGQPQSNKQTSYNDPKSYQQQMSNNGPQQFGLSHNAQPSSISGYPLLQGHNLDGSNMNTQSGSQQQLQQQQQHSSSQRGGNQVNPSKYYTSWN